MRSKGDFARPQKFRYVLWLGRTWGRRAESASYLTAPAYASKARQLFERSVMLDTSNKEALNDLFEYYMEAPGFLGGGLDRLKRWCSASELLDEAEGHYAKAQLADKRKEFDAAEQQLRRALELAPRQLGRVLDLAKYLSKLGRVEESEAASRAGGESRLPAIRASCTSGRAPTSGTIATWQRLANC